MKKIIVAVLTVALLLTSAAAFAAPGGKGGPMGGPQGGRQMEQRDDRQGGDRQAPGGDQKNNDRQGLSERVTVFAHSITHRFSCLFSCFDFKVFIELIKRIFIFTNLL